MPDTYTCAMCGGTFVNETPEEERLAEVRSHFGQSIQKEETTVVCDDCYKRMDPAKHPHLVELAVQEHMADRRKQP